jgi:hypothetical protein
VLVLDGKEQSVGSSRSAWIILSFSQSLQLVSASLKENTKSWNELARLSYHLMQHKVVEEQLHLAAKDMDNTKC